MQVASSKNYAFIIHSSLINTDVIVSDPAIALSLKKDTLSLAPFNPKEYNKGK